MERFEAWLSEHDIGVLGQYSTGSGDMLRFRLRLPDGYEFDIALRGEALLERPEEAIEQVRSEIDKRRGVNNGRSDGHR